MINSPQTHAPATGPIIAKLIEVIGDENATLASQSLTKHAGYTDRKNQILRELIVMQRRGATDPSEPGLRQLLSHLSDLLQVNAKLLKHHISAVGEVSDIIVAGLRGAESDGTYSRGSTVLRSR